MTYPKTYQTPFQLVQLLANRNLIIEDTNRSEQYLKRIGYFRLSAYFYPLLEFPKDNHRFKEGSTFQKALNMYRFDRQLRLLIFNQIEKIEIAVRAAIVNIMSRETNDIFWMTNPAHFANESRFINTLQKIDDEYFHSREDFIEHFRDTYEEPYAPSWMLAEILPLGVLTRIYENIRDNRLRKLIAQEFELNIPVFTSWMTIITVTRNSCCHHARMWNRVLTLRALTLNKWPRPWVSPSIQQGRIFFTLCIIKYLMNNIVPNNDLTNKLEKLFQSYPDIDISAMGFPKDWQAEPLWQ